MRLGGKLHNKVHCHICPLKEICNYAVPNESYRYYHHTDSYSLSDSQFISDMVSVRLATANCPLKEILKDE